MSQNLTVSVENYADELFGLRLYLNATMQAPCVHAHSHTSIGMYSHTH